jgi:hypothetical protein
MHTGFPAPTIKSESGFLAQPGVMPVAVCEVYDPDRQRAAQMCKGIIAGFKGFRRLPDGNDIDALIVVTPQSFACPPDYHGFSSGQGRLRSESNRKRALAEDPKGRANSVGAPVSPVLGFPSSQAKRRNAGAIRFLAVLWRVRQRESIPQRKAHSK